MDLVAENGGAPGGALSTGAEGARPSPESRGEKVGDDAGRELAGGEVPVIGWSGTQEIGDGGERGGQRAEEMRVNLTVVKQEVMDWPEKEVGRLGGQWAKQEIDFGPEVEEKPGDLEAMQERSVVVKEEKPSEQEVKEEKVKVEAQAGDWHAVLREVAKEMVEIKPEEQWAGRDVESPPRDEACVEDGLAFPEEEKVLDATSEAAPPSSLTVGAKRKLAMSR